MRVMYLINGLRYGGMERQLVAMIQGITIAGHEAYLAVLNKEGPMAGDIEASLSRNIFYIDRRKISIIKSMIKIGRIARHLKVNVIHVQDSFSAFYAFPVAKLLGMIIVNGSIRHAGVSKRLNYIFDISLLRISDVIISNSQAGLDYYRINGHVVYNFIDLARFKRSQAPLTNIVMNANFTEYKDHLTLILAGKKLIYEGMIEKIGLIGDGKHRQFYVNLCARMGISDYLVFHGHSSKVEELLLEYGIGVLCSTNEYKEGVSNSILEYMGAGLIAIGSNIGAIPEVIQDGYNGFTFSPEDPSSLSDKIRYVIRNSDKMADVRANAITTLHTKFSIDANCDQLIKIYDYGIGVK